MVFTTGFPMTLELPWAQACASHSTRQQWVSLRRHLPQLYSAAPRRERVLLVVSVAHPGRQHAEEEDQEVERRQTAVMEWPTRQTDLPSARTRPTNQFAAKLQAGPQYWLWAVSLSAFACPRLGVIAILVVLLDPVELHNDLCRCAVCRSSIAFGSGPHLRHREHHERHGDRAHLVNLHGKSGSKSPGCVCWERSRENRKKAGWTPEDMQRHDHLLSTRLSDNWKHAHLAEAHLSDYSLFFAHPSCIRFLEGCHIGCHPCEGLPCDTPPDEDYPCGHCRLSELCPENMPQNSCCSPLEGHAHTCPDGFGLQEPLMLNSGASLSRLAAAAANATLLLQALYSSRTR